MSLLVVPLDRLRLSCANGKGSMMNIVGDSGCIVLTAGLLLSAGVEGIARSRSWPAAAPVATIVRNR